MRISQARACIACVLSLAVGPFATAATSQGELTLAQAIALTFEHNPDLRASSFELSAAQARVAQASVRPNPELALELENFSGSGFARGADALESTLNLSQVIELGGKRDLRVSSAQADRDLVSTEQRARELDVLAEVTRRFIDVVSAQERTRLAAESTRLTQRTLDAITARVAAAHSPEAERSRARIALTRSHIEQQQMQSQLRSARHALSSLWADTAPRFTSARADLFALQPVQPFESMTAQLERSPDFLRFASEARLRDAQTRLARAQARPNLAFSLGVRRFEENNDAALVAGFSMPLPVFDRHRGAIREAEIRRNQGDAQREAAFVRARSTLYSLYEELLSVRARVETLRNEALPQAQIALDQTRYGYRRGRFSFLELITAQQELLGLRGAAIDAAADYHLLLAELERLTNEPLAAHAAGNEP